MVIPIGTRVINKNIIYSDTVLNLKDFGKNIIVTRVEKVNNREFDECIQLIFKENKDVVFNTIQYSRKDKKIYLYTDKPVSIKAWTDKNKNEFTYQSYDKNILEKIKSDLETEDSLDSSIVSLYDVWRVYNKKNSIFDSKIKKIESNIDKIINKEFKSELLSIWHSSMDDSITVRICANDYTSKGDGIFVFKREKNGDLYISSSDKKMLCRVDESKLLMYIGDEVAELFALYDNNRRSDLKWNVRSSSDIFTVKISSYFISITSSDGIIDIDLNASNGKVKIECNSKDILSCIKGHEKELFKKLFVNIEDCPESIKNELYCYRYNYLKKLEEEKILQAKREKTLRYKFKSFMKKCLK